MRMTHRFGGLEFDLVGHVISNAQGGVQCRGNENTARGDSHAYVFVVPIMHPLASTKRKGSRTSFNGFKWLEKNISLPKNVMHYVINGCIIQNKDASSK